MLMPSIFGENLFDDFFGDFVRPARNAVKYNVPAANVMKTDIKETESGYELDIELPGFKKEDVKVELKDGCLAITAAVSSSSDEKDSAGRYVRRERYYGNCSRTFYVGEDITQEDVKARFEDGILKLAVPKKEAKPKIAENKYITIEG